MGIVYKPQINGLDAVSEVSLAAVGSSPNANGASISGTQVLNLQPADATNPGVVTTGAQTFAGAKTFSSTIVGSINGNAATVTTNANLTGDVTSTGNATSYNATVPATKGGTAQTTYSTGDTLYASGSNTLAKRAIGSTGDVLTVAGGVPTWAAPSPGHPTTATSSSSGNFSTSSTSPVDITNLSVSLTTTGGLVGLSLVADGTTNTGAIGVFRSGAAADVGLDIYQDATLISRQHLTTNSTGEIDIPPSAVAHYYVPSAGTYTFKVQMSVTNGGATGFCQFVKLIAWTM